MTVSRKVAINTIALFTTKLLSSILSLLISVLLARHLGASGYGDYSIVFAYLSFFQVLTGLGIDSIVVKEVSRDASNQNAVVSNAIILKIIFSILAILAAIIIAHLMGYSKDIRLLIYIASFAMIFSFGTVYTALFQSKLKAAYYTIPELIVNIVISLLMFLFILLKAPIVVFVLLQSLIVIPITVIYVIASKKFIDFKAGFQYDSVLCRSMLSQSWPIFLSSVFVSIYMRIDQVMLFRMVGANELGLYSAGVKLAESLNIIPIVFMTSIYPLLCDNFVRSKEMFTKMYTRSFKYMSIVILPIAVGTTLLSGRIMTFFFGGSFLEASGTLSILIWSEIFVFLGVVFANVLTAAGIQRYMFLFTLLGAVINVILNIILIPRYGIIGASIATLLSYGVFGLILQYMIRETRIFTVDYLVSLIKPASCVIPMGLFVYFTSNLNLFFVILMSAVIYLIGILATRTLDRDDLNYIKSIFLRPENNIETAGPDR